MYALTGSIEVILNELSADGRNLIIDEDPDFVPGPNEFCDGVNSNGHGEPSSMACMSLSIYFLFFNNFCFLIFLNIKIL